MLKSNVLEIYSHKYIKIKVDSDDALPLEKTLNMHDVVISVESVFNKNYNHCCYKTFLERFLYKQQIKCYIIIGLIFLKVLMLTRQLHLKNLLFVSIGIF